MKNTFHVVMPLLIMSILSFSTTYAENAARSVTKKDDEYLISKWRVEKIGLEDIDRHYCSAHGHLNKKCKKGYKISETARWKDFISIYQKDDEIWFFTSPPETWEELMGVQGYAIFKRDILRAYITTLMN